MDLMGLKVDGVAGKAPGMRGDGRGAPFMGSP